MLYRVFPMAPGGGSSSRPSQPGGPLHVPRERQGVGRYDQPEHYGALYASRSAVSAVAERIQGFRGQTLADADLRMVDGTQWALATIDDDALGPLVDLDDPVELIARRLRPSEVATRERSATRAIALGLFEEGHAGFAWWSTLESSWSNVTLFAERAVPRVAIAGEPEPLTIRRPVLRAAANAIGVRLLR